jgi:chromate transport protein ChrA
MQSFVIGLSSQRMYRDLFWQLATVAPVLILVLVALLPVARLRRAAATCLLFGAVGAAMVAIVFHYNYALVIWGTHDSAIRWLDVSAAQAGFAAGGLAYVSAATGCALARMARRA